MKNLHHFSAFLAVGRRYSVDIKLHSFGKTTAALAYESTELSSFVEGVMGNLDDFLSHFEHLSHYSEAAKLFRSVDSMVEYYDVEVFANLAALVADINRASM